MKSKPNGRSLPFILANLIPLLLVLPGGLAVTRLLYEALFPRALWLGQPLPVWLIALLLAGLSRPLWQKWGGDWRATAVFFPFLLNLAYLPDPNVSLLRGWFFFLTSAWLVALFASHLQYPQPSRWRDALFLIGYLAPIYLLTMGRTVGQADTFEFQVVIPRLQIAHPSGYPLYILLTKPFTWLPFGAVAWRVNLASVVYALVAVYLLYELVKNLTQRRKGAKTQREKSAKSVDSLSAVLTAVAFGLTPTFWSQAAVAEVYALQTLIVTAALLIMVKISNWQLAISNWQLPIGLAFVLGLGLTNHLTTVILIPPAFLTLFFARRHLRSQFTIRHSLLTIAAFLLPLLLYAYLPIRWQMIHGEPMGFANFIGWITGSRFQGSLQLMAWLRDTTRYEVIGRLLVAEWGTVYLWTAALGFLFLAWQRWRFALTLLVAWLGYLFYALNYYVPDLNVFLIPAFLLVGISFGLFLTVISGQWTVDSGHASRITHHASAIILTIMMTPLLITAVIQTWPQVDQSGRDGLVAWGMDALQRPLRPNSAILADSEKIAPLYYLQQAEGMRPDLDIMVLPDENAYRHELQQRLANGQPVYLARFLPGLQGSYHLRSVGPLIEVSPDPLMTLPETAVATNLTFHHLNLIAYDLESSAITLYWQNCQLLIANCQLLIDEPLYIYLRWQDGKPFNPTGQHPANNSYPTNAFKGDEIVSDYHLLRPPISPEPQKLALQIALAPPFTPADELAWQTLTTVDVPPTNGLDLERPLRAQVGEIALQGINAPNRIRPQSPLSVELNGWGQSIDDFAIYLWPKDEPNWGEHFRLKPTRITANPLSWALTMDTTSLPPGQYQLFASYPKMASRCGMAGGVCEHPAAYCGWLKPATMGCALRTIDISGVPLPETAVNFDDKIALLDITVPDTVLQPGGQFPLTLHWQSLAPLNENYTIFIQILDANDRIGAQIDSWPLHGTFPTSQWTAGQTLTDPYTLQLASDLPSGEYRLLIGWYLLADLRRLPILDADGAPIEDKVILPGLVVVDGN